VPYGRSFALFALGKIKDPAIQLALPEVVGSLLHPDREVRDSAARLLGKIAEIVPAASLTERRRSEITEALFRVLSDPQPAVRAKAIRSLGKAARARYLTPDQELRLERAVLHILGEDERHEWDNAFIVRREAAEVRKGLTA
jgi:HEAT repeat protein